ncbi:acyltransferase domain-containing protein [Thiorhodococcus mannitoliphagus]|uniref:Acyltransferase domain-containing protein n=1 Tax=Thiorhodococcus mannitoliphagus TaxID=329406 RepID=A0A6P1DWJ7_9GAMM|nr:type I polyketide synthase [Thiorhodococcus mannitoliphagus]NEX22079.1 acyltransferase domain-containing protein [Thiorhodococcus mannitoliphagus]
MNDQARSGSRPDSRPDKIAVVGCGLRLPGDIDSLDALWRFLVAGGDAIDDLPQNRWVNDLYDPQPRAGRTYVRRGGYLSDLARIDRSFMGVSPREALQIDPQQRLLVETAYEALEQAGLPLQKLARGRTGVFVGISSNDYIQAMNDDVRRGNAYTNTGGALSIAANRLSYIFDLRGPSFAVDTACSSGLTAFDAAVRSLRLGACELAIVGAANALIRAEPFVGFAQATMLSPVGQCRAFDADGQGFVRAEGAISFILKPLQAALHDRDPILCVVEGSDTNNDGRTAGLSLPNGEAQQALIERVLRENAIDPANIAYFEAHGTGTAAGDPIEAGAIGRAIATQRPGDMPLLLGSIKTNIGHLEPASGLAGLAKAILCLNQGAAPKSLHFETPNPAIDFDGLRLKVVEDLTPLPPTPGPRMAAVNSFGFGGANAHVVISEAPSPARIQPSILTSIQSVTNSCTPSPTAMERPWILVSARAPEAMRRVAAQVAEFIDQRGERLSLTDLAATLLTRRTWHPHRAAVWADDLAAMRSALETIARDALPDTAVLGSPIQGARTAFVFTGNGPQWWGMGRELYAASRTFRATLDEVDAILRGISDLKLIEEMHRSKSDNVMARTEIAQPALFALQLGLVRCLAEDGLVADGVVGHSAGELAAAHCAGLFDLETILRIVSARSQEQGKTAGDGAMAAIGLGLDDAEARLRDFEGLVMAGDNGPAAVSVAGPEDSIDALVEALTAQGTVAKKLRLNYAFHSAAMDRIETPFRALVADVQGAAGQCPFYSTVTGSALHGEAMNADYWWRNLREPVRFRPAIAQMLDDGYGVFVEVGPHPALLGYVKGVARRANRGCQTIETLRRGENEPLQRRKTIASAAVAGAHLDLARVFPDPVPPLELPSYPWQYERAFNHPPRRAPLVEASEMHALLGAKVSLAQPTWVNELALSRTPFIADHRIRGTVLFPAAGFIEMAVAAGQAASDAAKDANRKAEQVELHNLRIEKPLPLDDAREILLQTFFDQTDHSLSIQSRPIAVAKDGEETEPAPFTEHVRATIEHRPRVARTIDLEGLKATLSKRRRAPEEHYRLSEARGLHYGPSFQTVVTQFLGDGEVLVELKRQAGECGAFTLDPTQIDGALQAMIGLIDSADDQRLFVPVHLGRLAVLGSTQTHESVYAHVVARRANRFFLTADIRIIAADGSLLAELEDMQVRAIGSGSGKAALLLQHRLKPLRLFDDRLPVVAPDALLAKAPRLPLADPDSDHAPDPSELRRSDFGAAVERLCAAFAADTFAGISEGMAFSLQDLVTAGHLDEHRWGYAEALLANVVAHGFATAEGDRFRMEPAPRPQMLWQALTRRYPGYHAELFLAARVWQQLPALLVAGQAPEDRLFPQAGSVLLEQVLEQGFYRRNANAMLSAVIANYLCQLPTGRPLRLLEVGAGLGGATAGLLRSIDASRVEYVFTDATDAALASAERRFGSTPNFQTRTLDLLTNPDAAELGGPFDILVCAHALHRMPSLRQSLAAMRPLLRENGLLALIEPERNAYFDFVFGLLPGAWSFTDTEDRPDHALLPGADWPALLESAGLAHVTRWSAGVEHGHPPASLLLGLNRAEQREHSTPVAQAPEPVDWLFFGSDDASGVEAMLWRRIEAGGGRVTHLDMAGSADEVEARCAAFARETASAPPARAVVFAPHAGVADGIAEDTGWPLQNS